jgi:uncharacterized protein
MAQIEEPDPVEEYLQLADWRRRVAEMYAGWRAQAINDPVSATSKWRSDRDELFRDHPQSPIPENVRARFGGLSYFAYDPDYRMTATLERADAPRSDRGGLALPALVQLPSSGAEPFSFRQIGLVHLSGPLAGQTLPVFWMEGYAGGLFIPFRDATSGSETYGAGRYLLDSVKGADLGSDPNAPELLLDFNMAYHPSCAYDPKWNCPLAPPASRLGSAVRVGEYLVADGTG